jgi:L-erythro-3,5-diaminohexanoate dehydrogenase
VTPVTGAPGGEHRVLEPAGATPASARRLDALADLWDGEVRLDLTALVLDPADLAAWRQRLGASAEGLAAALVEGVAERGAFADEPGRGTLLGHVAAVGRAHPWPATVGELVALAQPAVAIPAFAVPGRWDGASPVVPLRGHAIAPAGVPTVLAEGGSAEAARTVARNAEVPAAVDALVDAAGAPAGGPHLVLLGADRVAGAIALAHLAALGRSVCAVVETLQGADLAATLGATSVVVADLASPVETATVIAQADPGPFDLALVAAPAAAALSVRLAPRVAAVGDVPLDPILLAADEGGRAVDVSAHREPGAGRGARVRDLVASSPALAELLRWRSGRPTPTSTGHEPPPWERT